MLQFFEIRQIISAKAKITRPPGPFISLKAIRRSGPHNPPRPLPPSCGCTAFPGGRDQPSPGDRKRTNRLIQGHPSDRRLFVQFLSERQDRGEPAPPDPGEYNLNFSNAHCDHDSSIIKRPDNRLHFDNRLELIEGGFNAMENRCDRAVLLSDLRFRRNDAKQRARVHRANITNRQIVDLRD
jgi:hypothetical protein